MSATGSDQTSIESLVSQLDVIASSLFVQNAFWVFVGIVAGSLIQFVLHFLILRSQRNKAARLFAAEIEINEGALALVESSLKRKKERFAANQQTDGDFWFDYSTFNYRMVDPLINTGHFHDIFGSKGVKLYFQFMNDLNLDAATRAEQILRGEAKKGQSLACLDWFLETRLPQWKETLEYMRARIQ